MIILVSFLPFFLDRCKFKAFACPCLLFRLRECVCVCVMYKQNQSYQNEIEKYFLGQVLLFVSIYRYILL